MTNRHEMLPKDLKPFEEFIKSKGCKLVEFQHAFEVLRAERATAKSNKFVMSIYKRYKNPYLTVTEHSWDYWQEYKRKHNWKPTEYADLLKGDKNA